MNPNDKNAPDDAPDDHEIVRREDYDCSEPLDDPAFEAIAQFFAAPRQFRQFNSVSALAEHLGVSRMTVYRRAEDADVVLRIRWLLAKSMFFGDLVACREWPAIVEVQVKAALAGDIRAAIFCQNRAWRQSSIGDTSPEPAIAGVHAISIWQEKANETAQAEEKAAKENPETEGKNPSE